MQSLTHDKAILITFLLASALLHLLWFDWPASVVFDEVYFGQYASAYCCSHTPFFDLHPPHGKLLIAGVAWLAGYDGGLGFAQIGDRYGQSAWPLRLLPMLCGTLLPLLCYGLVRQLGGGSATAFWAGALAALDNALLTQTRFILIDGLLLVAVLATLMAFLHAVRLPSSAQRSVLLLGAGALAGLAAGIKLTGLVASAVIGHYLLIQWLRAPGWPGLRRTLPDAGWLASGFLLAWFGGWYLHFLLLSPGQIGLGELPLRATSAWLEGLRAHSGLALGHANASHWWSWPLMGTPVYYWAGNGVDIYLFGNPVVWLGSSLLMLVMLASLARGLWQAGGHDRHPHSLLWLPLTAYCISFLPLSQIGRVMFNYHYLMPLLFCLISLALWLERGGWIRPGGLATQRAGYYASLAIALIGFVALAPVSYGIGGWNATLVALLRQLPQWSG